MDFSKLLWQGQLAVMVSRIALCVCEKLRLPGNLNEGVSVSEWEVRQWWIAPRKLENNNQGSMLPDPLHTCPRCVCVREREREEHFYFFYFLSQWRITITINKNLYLTWSMCRRVLHTEAEVAFNCYSFTIFPHSQRSFVIYLFVFLLTKNITTSSSGFLGQRFNNRQLGLHFWHHFVNIGSIWQNFWCYWLNMTKFFPNFVNSSWFWWIMHVV